MPDLTTTIECAYCCEVPAELGAVTGLDVSHGKVIATTESGIPMIVPVHRDAEDWVGIKKNVVWIDDGLPVF